MRGRPALLAAGGMGAGPVRVCAGCNWPTARSPGSGTAAEPRNRPTAHSHGRETHRSGQKLAHGWGTAHLPAATKLANRLQAKNRSAPDQPHTAPGAPRTPQRV